MTFRDEIERETSKPTVVDFLRAIGVAIAATWRGWRAPVRRDFEREACDRADLVVKDSITKARRQLRGGGDDAA